MQKLGKTAFRIIKNYALGYSETQVKVRDATSNDPLGPSVAQMHEIAQLTCNADNNLWEIIDILDKRLNDTAKNWRHILKSLTIIEYILHQGPQKIFIYYHKNMDLITSLRDFQYIDEDGYERGAGIRRKVLDITADITERAFNDSLTLEVKEPRRSYLKASPDMTYIQDGDKEGEDDIDAGTEANTSLTVPRPTPRSSRPSQLTSPNRSSTRGGYQLSMEESDLQLAIRLADEEQATEVQTFVPGSDRETNETLLQLAMRQHTLVVDNPLSVADTIFDITELEQQTTLSARYTQQPRQNPLAQFGHQQQQSNNEGKPLEHPSMLSLGRPPNHLNRPEQSKATGGIKFPPTSPRALKLPEDEANHPLSAADTKIDVTSPKQQLTTLDPHRQGPNLKRETEAGPLPEEKLSVQFQGQPNDGEQWKDQVIFRRLNHSNRPWRNKAIKESKSPPTTPEASDVLPPLSNTPTPQSPTDKTISILLTICNDSEHYRRFLKCNHSDAQIVLELCQNLLDSCDIRNDVRKQLVTAMQRLAAKTKNFPSYFFIHGSISLAQEYAVRSGSFGDIYKATLHNESLCLKVLRANQSILHKLAKSFAKEAILWSQLSHPNVLPFYGLHIFRSQLSFVSPWAENGSIMEFLNKKNASADRLLLSLDAAMGVEYLHATGVVHGDIKSVNANVLVDRSGRAYLADFGLSNIDDPHIVHWTSQSSVASRGGSARWQAPELHQSDNDSDAEASIGIHNTEKSDVFAWGCLCYEIFTGYLPFYHIRLPTTVVLKILAGHKPLRPKAEEPAWLRHGLTEPIWALMEQCWDSDSVARPDMSTIVSQLKVEHPLSDPRPGPQWPAGSAMRFRESVSVDLIGQHRTHTVEDLGAVLSKVTGLKV
ncbi:hypothetical protein DXG01_016206 [Tephrocybe rancida]|nr:hypothetical protein DXG01_016206 [Tephrocybe rancida]